MSLYTLTGVVIGLEDDNMHQVRYYDGIEAMVPREELYMLSTDKFETDCAYILACEESLVGQAVVTRNDDDGTFHLGRSYVIMLLYCWAYPWNWEGG